MEVNEDYFLYQRLKEGDKKAFTCIYELYWGKLYAFGLKLSGDKNLTENMVQDIFIQLWEKRRTKDIHNVKAYLFQSVKFRLFSHYKTSRLVPETLVTDFVDYIQYSADDGQSEILNRLSKALDKLTPNRRDILFMSKVQEMNSLQIAEVLGISPQTVRNQLSIALNQLKGLLDKEDFILLLFVLSKL